MAQSAVLRGSKTRNTVSKCQRKKKNILLLFPLYWSHRGEELSNSFNTSGRCQLSLKPCPAIIWTSMKYCQKVMDVRFPLAWISKSNHLKHQWNLNIKKYYLRLVPTYVFHKQYHKRLARQPKVGKKRVEQDGQQQNLRWVDVISQTLPFLNFVNPRGFCKTRKDRIH